MRTIALTLTMLLCVLVAGCASFPKDDIDIAVESDPNANFSQYKTYSWIGSATTLNDPQGKWERPDFDTSSLVAALIDRELQKHGMTESAVDPDTLVAFAIGADMENMKFKTDATNNVDILQNVPQGALVVVLMDAVTETVSWTGVAVADLQNRGDDVLKKRINYTIEQMFEKFPKK